MAKIEALLFDKDGTLFEFSATWDSWGLALINELSQGDSTVADAMAHEMVFDLTAGGFLPASPIIAGTNREAAECVCRALPHWPVDKMEAHLAMRASEAPLIEAVPLAPYLQGLTANGLTLGVMTNDAESVAHAQLGQVGVGGHFAFIAGSDSGFGAKPDPDPLLAFARACDIAPERVAMVGDSAHDLLAGRAAGMATIGVLTGLATIDDLTHLADVVLPDIGHIPAWLAG